MSYQPGVTEITTLVKLSSLATFYLIWADNPAIISNIAVPSTSQISTITSLSKENTFIVYIGNIES